MTLESHVKSPGEKASIKEKINVEFSCSLWMLLGLIYWELFFRSRTSKKINFVFFSQSLYQGRRRRRMEKKWVGMANGETENWLREIVCLLYNGRVVFCNLISFLFFDFKQKQDNFPIARKTRSIFCSLCKHIHLAVLFFIAIKALRSRRRCRAIDCKIRMRM